MDNWADVDNLPVRRAAPFDYVVVLGDDEEFGVELDDVELDDVVASSFDFSEVPDPSEPLFDDSGLEPFDPLLCALLSVR